jgi:endonuclease/exonuclease/phosphatase family metal-dependent hydrolase
VNAVNFIVLVLTHFVAMLRMAALVLWETVLAVMDFVYGLIKKENVLVEFKFVFLRVCLCILLRELITLGASIDAARGLPVIHLNFIGYDEQAHRRGPGSQTAHWALKGIDKAISRIYSAALHSRQRHYDVWVYSDHGQEPTIPYIGFYGRGVEEAVSQVFQRLFPESKPARGMMQDQEDGVQLQRGRYLGRWVEKIWRLNPTVNHAPDFAVNHDVTVAAMGPVGGVYIFKELTPDQKFQLARELVQSAHIPLVLMPDVDGKVRAWNEKGEFILPEQAGEIFEPENPFFDEVVNDLVSLCHHPNAGTFTISGWRRDGVPLSFPFENGAHAGPGKKETDAFALLPSYTIPDPQQKPYLKTADLRQAALRLLKRSRGLPQSRVPSKTKTLRMMTYNVHSCIGMDGKVSPQRIARVIGRYEPDIVALQELDMGRKRTLNMDQPHLIAKELEMMYHFHPAIQVEEEKYGNAILSRYPINLIRAASLPALKTKLKLEPRGALWVSIAIDDVVLQIVNAHLSFYVPECRHQARALVGPEWLGHPDCAAPAVLCGDFNCLPKSRAWRTINHHLGDAQHILDQHRPLATWFRLASARRTVNQPRTCQPISRSIGTLASVVGGLNSTVV